MALKCLKRYRVQELEPGMVLGKTILNGKGQVMMDQGKVIFQEGTPVTRETVDRLKNSNICMVDVLVTMPSRLARSSEKRETPPDGQDAQEKLETSVLAGMAKTEPLSVVLDRLATGLGALYPNDSVFVTLLEGNPLRWWVAASTGSFSLPDISREHKFQGTAYLGGQTVNIGELSIHKAPPVLARADMFSLCGAPILVEGKTAGAIEVFSHRPHAFSQEDENRLSRIARLAAVSVQCSRRHEIFRQTADERDLLYEIIGFVSASMPPGQLLSKVADSLRNYLCAHAVASFAVQRLPQMNKIMEVLVRNFSRTDMENLKEIFSERWPVVSNSSAEENAPPYPAELQQAFTVTLSGGKSIYILPLFSRDLLQGIIVLLWEYERRLEHYRHMDEMMNIVATQTALGIERHHLYSGVEKIGLTDELTGLFNRRMFNYLMEREISRSRRYGRPLSLVMMDIDHFKKVNDTWGHPAGDAVLRELGALMRRSLRRLDVPVRYGGEEFAVILPETPLDEAVLLAERVRIAVEKASFIVESNRIPVTISLGVASMGSSTGSEDLDSAELLHYADRALYQAKQNGRNRIAVGRGNSVK